MRLWLFSFTVLGFLLGTSLASAEEGSLAPVKVLVSLGEMKSGSTQEWRKSVCTDLHAIANAQVDRGVQVTCRNFEPLHAIDTYLQQLKKGQAYHLRLIKGFRNSYHLDISHWSRTIESDFTSLSWQINSGESGLKQVLANFFSFISQEEALKINYLLSALATSDEISYNFKDLHFTRKSDRKRISNGTALSVFEKESTAHARYLKARIEMALLFTTTLPEDTNLLQPDSSLATALIKAGRVARAKDTQWRRQVRPEDRASSQLVQFIIENPDAQQQDWAELSLLLGSNAHFEVPPMTKTSFEPVAANNFAAKLKKPAGKLIFLF